MTNNKKKARAKARSKTPVKTRADVKRTTPPTRPARQAGQKDETGSIDALAAAGTKALGIRIDLSWEASVKFNLQLIFTHAANVDGFALPDDAELAPIFHA